MPGIEIQPFADEHLDAAAGLLAERHGGHRKAEPLLVASFEEPARAREELESAWRVDGASGAAAFRDDRPIGFLVGAPRDTRVWGDNIWIEYAGHAAEDAELVRDLYAFAAARWVEEGRDRHYALVPAHDDAVVDAWFRLGFGHQQAHGVQEVSPREATIPPGFEVRPPSAADVDALLEVELALPRHQQSSPVFSGQPLPSEEELRADWADALGDEEEQILIGYRGGKPVACWSVSPAERSSQHRGMGMPERACYLGFASTLPEARGSGVGVALTDESLTRASAAGYAAMVTDWRVPNLLASRFWPRRGFRETFLRLYRRLP